MFSHRLSFVSTVWWIFTVFSSEADTVGQAETNWSREKQISVSQSGSPTLLALRRVSNQRSLARSPTISKIPADGWEITATICCRRQTHTFAHASPWSKSTAIIQAIWETENFNARLLKKTWHYLQIITVKRDVCSLRGTDCEKEARTSWQAGDHGIMKDLRNNDTYVPILHHSLNWDNISRIRDDRPW